MVWLFLLIVWVVVSLIGIASFVFETDSGVGNYTLLPILYRSILNKCSMFNIVGKVTMCVLTTLLLLPMILFNYIVLFPLMLIVWLLLNFFWWLFTIDFRKKKKEDKITYAQVGPITIEMEIKK